MEPLSLRRLTAEFEELRKDKVLLVSPNPKDLFKWNVTMVGPKESPWEGGVYSTTIIFPQCYPFKPPKVQFLTPIYTPIIHYPSGNICKCENDSSNYNWNPAHSASHRLLQVYQFAFVQCDILEGPCVINLEASRLLEENKIEEFINKAREINREQMIKRKETEKDIQIPQNIYRFYPPISNGEYSQLERAITQGIG